MPQWIANRAYVPGVRPFHHFLHGSIPMEYWVPDLAEGTFFRMETTIRRSRFIVSLARAPDAQAARERVERVRRDFPDATRNCWAFAAGPPGSAGQAGYSDDGEPHGTAGRPMLTLLLHGDTGEICAVVTRYFGGVKLGSGGLVRAYQGTLRLGLNSLPRRLFRSLARLEVTIPYSRVDRLRRLLPEFAATIEEERFGAKAFFSLRLPETRMEDFSRALAAATEGGALIKRGPAHDDP
jgi:uncharacterized YigZ family protein